MMKYLFLICFCLSSILIFGQNRKFTFKLGQEYKLSRNATDLGFFGNQTDGIINVSIKKDELNIISFDPKTLNKKAEKTIELKETSRNFNSEVIIEMNDNFFWLHSDWEKSTEKEMLFADRIDVKTGKLIDVNRKLLETTKLSGTQASAGFYSMKTVDKYKFNHDAENKKLLVSYTLEPKERNSKKNYDVIGLQVFDEKLNKIWSNEFTMPYTERLMDKSDFTVDNKGNAYLLAKIYNSDARKEVDKKTGLPEYHYEVLKFTKDTKEIIHTTIATDDYFIKETSLIENSLHEIIIASTYTKKLNTGVVFFQYATTKTDGVFLAILDPSGKVIKYKNGFYEFPLAEMQKFESEGMQRKMEKASDYEITNLHVKNVLVEGDGSVIIACEQSYSITRNSTTNNGYISSTTTFYYEDIIATKIDALGKFAWLSKIPKRQLGSSRAPGTMSFKFIGDQSDYYFLYLDNKKNMELAKNEAPKTHVDGKGGQVIIAKIDEKGRLTKEILFDTRDEDIMVYPTEFDQINGNQFIGRAKIKNTLFQPILITVNNTVGNLLTRR